MCFAEEKKTYTRAVRWLLWLFCCWCCWPSSSLVRKRATEIERHQSVSVWESEEVHFAKFHMCWCCARTLLLMISGWLVKIVWKLRVVGLCLRKGTFFWKLYTLLCALSCAAARDRLSQVSSTHSHNNNNNNSVDFPKLRSPHQRLHLWLYSPTARVVATYFFPD